MYVCERVRHISRAHARTHVHTQAAAAWDTNSESAPASAHERIHFFIIFLFYFTNTQAAAAWDTNSEALTASAHELTRYVCVCMCMYVYVCIDAYNIFIDMLCIVQRLHMYEYI